AGVVAAGPRFAADAVADPLTGVLAAVAARAALAKGGSWFVDAPLVRAAAFAQSLAGAGGAPAGGGPAGGAAAPPRARHPAAPAAALGADTDAVLAALAAAG